MWLILPFDQINVVNFFFDQIKPEDMRAFFVPPGKGVYFHPGEKKHFLDAEASLAQGPGHRRSLWKPELEQIVHFCASQSSNSV